MRWDTLNVIHLFYKSVYILFFVSVWPFDDPEVEVADRNRPAVALNYISSPLRFDCNCLLM